MKITGKVLNELVKLINAILNYEAVKQITTVRVCSLHEKQLIRNRIDYDEIRRTEMVYELANHLIANKLLFEKETELADGNIQYSLTLYAISPQKEKR